MGAGQSGAVDIGLKMNDFYERFLEMNVEIRNHLAAYREMDEDAVEDAAGGTPRGAGEPGAPEVPETDDYHVSEEDYGSEVSEVLEDVGEVDEEIEEVEAEEVEEGEVDVADGIGEDEVSEASSYDPDLISDSESPSPQTPESPAIRRHNQHN